MRVSARTLAKELRAHLLGVLVVEFLTQDTVLVLFLLVGQFNVRRHIHPHVHQHLQEKLHEFVSVSFHARVRVRARVGGGGVKCVCVCRSVPGASAFVQICA